MKRKKTQPNPRPKAQEADAELLPTDEELEDPEALHEAEAELGINEWIDPDTGAPAEDSVPRLEDH
jgi:hypothetical protein